MNITIHRGANQIGGCITEISTDGAKILIDLGSNLPNGQVRELTKKEVSSITKDADAIFYTHYHGDHVGLFHLVPKSVPQYIGTGAKEVMLCKYQTLAKHTDLEKEVEAIKRFNTYKVYTDIIIKKKIKIRPYYVSHSAFDAYMFLIKVEGKTILHTGDFRTHGYLGKGLEYILREVQFNVDFLIIEGTTLGRKNEKMICEYDIKENTFKHLRSFRNKYTFALCSSTDIDRLSSFYNACKDAGRVFICDSYQKEMLGIFSRHTYSRGFYFNDLFTLNDYTSPNVYRYLRKKGFFMLIRPSMKTIVEKMLKTYNNYPAYLIYSMWQGYYNGTPEQVNPQIVEIRQLFEDHILDGTRDGFHTSGHANVETIQKVCRLLNPRIGIIPIHKEASSSFTSLEIAKEYRIIESSIEIENIRVSIM